MKEGSRWWINVRSNETLPMCCTPFSESRTCDCMNLIHVGGGAQQAPVRGAVPSPSQHCWLRALWDPASVWLTASLAEIYWAYRPARVCTLFQLPIASQQALRDWTWREGRIIYYGVNQVVSRVLWLVVYTMSPKVCCSVHCAAFNISNIHCVTAVSLYVQACSTYSFTVLCSSWNLINWPEL